MNAPTGSFGSVPEADHSFTAAPVMVGFQSPRNQFQNFDYQRQQPMVQVVFPFFPAPAPLYPLSMPDQGMPLSAMPDQSVPLSPITDYTVPLAHSPLTGIPNVVSPASPEIPMFVFSPQATNHQPLQHAHFSNVPMSVMPHQPQYYAPSTSVTPPPQAEETFRNKRNPPGFNNRKSQAKLSPKARKPLQNRTENTENPRRRNAKRKSKKQAEKVADGEYRPSYRSKQDMIDKVFLALSEKYTALGLLENKGLRGDDTIRVHVKNFKALTKIEEALVAVESHPCVKISKVSLPFSFRNEFQKKGFLVYLKLADVTMVPHAQSVFRQYDEFKKCGVMRETGQYVESLPLTQATPSTPIVPEEMASSDFDSNSENEKESTPDYASSTESASTEAAESDSEQLSKPVSRESFGPLTANNSTRAASNVTLRSGSLTNVHALMRTRRTSSEEERAPEKFGFDRVSLTHANLEKFAAATLL